MGGKQLTGGLKAFAESLVLPGQTQPQHAQPSESAQPATTEDVQRIIAETVDRRLQERDARELQERTARAEHPYELRGLSAGTAAYARSIKLAK